MTPPNRARFNPANVTLGGVVLAAVAALVAFALTGPSAVSMPISNPPPVAATPTEPGGNAGLEPAAGRPPRLDDTARGTDLDAVDPIERSQWYLIAPQPEWRRPVSRAVKVRRGDTLMTVLTSSGIDRRQGHAAVSALRQVFDPRSLRAGQEITLEFAADADGAPDRLLSVSLRESIDREVRVVRSLDDEFTPREIVHEFERRAVRAAGTIEDSLYMAASRAGVPDRIILDLIRMLSFSVDFEREIRPGDRFEILFERFFDEDGSPVKEGEILIAALTRGDKDDTYYRFTPSDNGFPGYFNERGQSVRKTLMRTPIDGARLSSRFGRRRHPILGYTRMHRGVDFRASRGTPIMAAGDGTIEMARWNGAYGRYIRIRHNSTYKTAYAHLSRFKRGIKRGRRVKQGEIIGYVGSTGRSTGPHLHYEVMASGRQVNPLVVRLPTGRKLKGEELTRFRERVIELRVQLATTPLESTVASAE